MKRFTALVALIAVAAVVVVSQRGLPPSSSTIAARQISATEPDAIAIPIPFPADSSLKFEVLRERTLTPYRLRPDRRLVLALTEIRRLAGAPDSAVTAQFGAGHWTVLCGSQEIGQLSELPDFPEMLELSTEWARKLAWARGWSENSGPERPDLVRALDRLDAPAALREADRAWAMGARDAALFRDAAHAYALLALETPNWGGLADPIAARSLATLAFARALGAEDPKRETCMLAQAMDYSATARALSRSLSARDPLRLYVNGDALGLERLATAALGAAGTRPAPAAVKRAAKPATKTGTVTKAASSVAKTTLTSPASVSLEAPYLHLRAVARRGDYETWSGLLKAFDRPGVPMALVLGSGIGIEHPDAALAVGEKLLRAMAPRPLAPKPRAVATKTSTRATVTATPPASLAQQVQRFEAVLGASPPPMRGILASPEIIRAQRRSLAYAALDEIAEHALETQGADLSRWFAVSSPKGKAKGVSDFQRWYAHLANARVGRPELATLQADVDSAAPGAEPALRSYQALRASIAPDDPSLRESARRLVRRMDSRPDHRIELAAIAERDLGALSVAERLGTSAAEVSDRSDPSLLVWRSRLRNEPDTLHRDTPKLAARPDSVLGVQLARRLAAHPTAWDATDRYATWLKERGSYASARRLLERWVARAQGDSGSVASIAARIRIAHLLQLEGHPERGLELLGDLHRSGHFGAMERTALILQDLGQPNQALAIAWAAHRRAPQLAAGRALLIELFWRQGHYAEAVNVLQDGPGKLSGADWTREIAPRYVEFFRTREREGLQAAEALMRAGFKDRATFGSIPDALGAQGLDALAFELQSRMQLSGAQGFESSILAYGYLKRAKGESAAVEWLKRRVPENDRILLGILAYQEQYPELLWSLAPPRLQGELGDYHWLLRAATCLAAGPSHRDYSETVRQVGRARGTDHLEIAKYLLGLREETEILALARTLRQRSEIYYFVGLKNEARGRLRDAADWYLMSADADTGNDLESRWAMQRLMLWIEDVRHHDPIAPAQPPPA